MKDILDVDLLAFEAGDRTARRAVVDGVRKSLETGFVYAAHDIDTDAIDAAYAMLASFFALPREKKDRCAAPGSRGQAGYTGMLVETAASSELPDWKEMLNWGPAIPAGHPLRERFPHRYIDPVFPDGDVPGIGQVLGHFHERLADLQRRFLRVIAVGIGCDEGYFEAMLKHGPTLTRAIRYPPMENAPSGEHVWAGEHGDINLITALPRATARGLQVKVDGDWVDAIAPDGHAIINTGLMLERVTNGAIPAGIHRVVADPTQAGERLSVVQFCHPTPWSVLAPVPSCVTADRPLRFGAIAAGDWLDEVLYEINLVEDSRRIETGDTSERGVN